MAYDIMMHTCTQRTEVTASEIFALHRCINSKAKQEEKNNNNDKPKEQKPHTHTQQTNNIAIKYNKNGWTFILFLN